MTPVGGINVNRRQYNKSFKTLHHVGWDCFRNGLQQEKIEALIADAADFSNISCAVFDDFKRIDARAQDESSKVTVEKLWNVKERLKNNEVRSLDMWMVMYTYEFGVDQEVDKEFMSYLEPFDGIIMWTWEEKDVSLIPEKFA